MKKFVKPAAYFKNDSPKIIKSSQNQQQNKFETLAQVIKLLPKLNLSKLFEGNQPQQTQNPIQTQQTQNLKNVRTASILENNRKLSQQLQSKK